MVCSLLIISSHWQASLFHSTPTKPPRPLVLWPYAGMGGSRDTNPLLLLKLLKLPVYWSELEKAPEVIILVLVSVPFLSCLSGMAVSPEERFLIRL